MVSTVNTRFNPTTNGPLHLGSAYMALVNAHLAHASGGRFLVRFDDCGEVVLAQVGATRAAHIAAGMLADLHWLGIEPDGVTWQSQTLPAIHADMRARGLEPEPEPLWLPTPLWTAAPQDRLCYPYTPRKTAEKVLLDAAEGVTWLVRGDDLLTEYSLYEHFRTLFDLPPVKHVYLPQLVAGTGGIGKSIGGYTISEYRALGWQPAQVLELLGRSCLQHWPNGWTLPNIKRQPRLAEGTA